MPTKIRSTSNSPVRVLHLERRNRPKILPLQVGRATATGTETVESIDSEWERVTVEEDASGNPKRFGRVKVVSGE